MFIALCHGRMDLPHPCLILHTFTMNCGHRTRIKVLPPRISSFFWRNPRFQVDYFQKFRMLLSTFRLKVGGFSRQGFFFGAWRSLAARNVRDVEVVGSNPTAPTILRSQLSGERSKPFVARRRAGRSRAGLMNPAASYLLVLRYLCYEAFGEAAWQASLWTSPSTTGTLPWHRSCGGTSYPRCHAISGPRRDSFHSSGIHPTLVGLYPGRFSFGSLMMASWGWGVA